jgi:uncharacterized protein
MTLCYLKTGEHTLFNQQPFTQINVPMKQTVYKPPVLTTLCFTALFCTALYWHSNAHSQSMMAERQQHGATQIDKLTSTEKSAQKLALAKNLSDQAFASYEKNQIATAVKLFKRSADLGDNSSKYNLAVIILTDESPLLSKRRALQYLQQAANAGFGLAQFMLGRHHEQGQYVKSSKELAFRWYEKAALNGIADAYLELATAYYLGRGTPQDYRKALQWYEKSAEAGDAPAQYLTASMYETGLGVSIDLDAALQWYSAAARQGDQAAQLKAKELANRIAHDQSKSRS